MFQDYSFDCLILLTLARPSAKRLPLPPADAQD